MLPARGCQVPKSAGLEAHTPLVLHAAACAAAQPLTYGGALREEREVGVVWVGWGEI